MLEYLVITGIDDLKGTNASTAWLDSLSKKTLAFLLFGTGILDRLCTFALTLVKNEANCLIATGF